MLYVALIAGQRDSDGKVVVAVVNVHIVVVVLHEAYYMSVIVHGSPRHHLRLDLVIQRGYRHLVYQDALLSGPALAPVARVLLGLIHIFVPIGQLVGLPIHYRGCELGGARVYGFGLVRFEDVVYSKGFDVEGLAATTGLVHLIFGDLPSH